MDFVHKAGARQGDGSLAAVRLRRTVHEQQTGVRSGCGGNQDLKQCTKSGVIWSVRKFISRIKGSSASPSCSLNLCPYSCRTEAIKMAPAITLKLSLCSVTWCMLWGCPQVGKTENTQNYSSLNQRWAGVSMHQHILPAQAHPAAISWEGAMGLCG